MMDFAQARRNMVDNQLRTFDVTDRALLAAMADVPRERFVPAERRAFAYSDGAVELPGTAAGPGRQLLSPMVVARLIQALGIESGQRVLDIAGGGYSAAVLATLGAEVVALEQDGPVADEIGARLRELGFGDRVSTASGPLRAGSADRAPFDAILLNGALEVEPVELLAQLAEGGRLACIRREGGASQATLYVKAHEGAGFRPLFDAPAPTLSEFARERGFVF